MGCGEMSSDQFASFLEGVFRQMATYTVDGSIHQVCMDWRHMLPDRNVFGSSRQEPMILEVVAACPF
jgi:hypothetical protein